MPRKQFGLGTPPELRRLAPTAREETLSRALEQVRMIEDYSTRGDVALARQARETLDSLCAEWSDTLGKLAYPEPVRDALRAAGLRQYPT